MIRLKKIAGWAKILSVYGSGQIIIQALALVGGLLIVRLLNTRDYALYTLANSLLATMTVLSDGGISMAVNSQAGPVWQDPKKLGLVISTGLALRRRFAIASVLIATPVLVYLLINHGALYWEIILLLAGVFLLFGLALSGGILEIPLKLHQAVVPLSKLGVAQGCIRLGGVAVGLWVWPHAAVAILGTGFAQAWGNWRLRKISGSLSENTNSQNAEARANILRIVRRSMPNSIYYCVSSQVSVYLVSIFGTTEALAQVGALGRISQILSVSSIILCGIFVPRYARLKIDSGLLTGRFILISCLGILIGFAIATGVYSFPELTLSILGKHYQNLRVEVVLMAVSGLMSMFGLIVYSLGAVRGWIVSPWIYIPLSIICQALPIPFLNLGTVSGVLWLGIIGGIGPFVFQFLYFINKAHQSDRKAV